MKITDKLNKGFTYSIELLPPKQVLSKDKKSSGSEETLKIAEYLKDVASFYSVTSGAGGRRERCGTISLSHIIEEKQGVECIAHLTCLESTIPDIKEQLADIANLGIRNILALRGDPPIGKETAAVYRDSDFKLAVGLIDYIIKETWQGYFCIGAAAHPEGHPEDKELDREERISKSLEELKIKQDAGADFAITQMVFDADVYFDFISKARDHDITMPIIPLVWPLRKISQCEFAINRFNVTVPFIELVRGYQDREQALVDRMISLCLELKSGGAPGIHFTSFENEDIVKQIIEYIR